MCVGALVLTHVCACACALVRLCPHMYVRVHVLVCMRVCMYVCVCACTRVCACACTRVHVRWCAHTCMTLGLLLVLELGKGLGGERGGRGAFSAHHCSPIKLYFR